MISVAKILPVSEVNGPGKRCVVWVQGCPKRCPGCWNPEFLSFEKSVELATPQELVTWISGMTNDFRDIEGVTFSGGEPFAYAEDLSEAAEILRKQNLSIMSYSGFTLEEIKLRSKFNVRLLEALDILVDGEYKRELAFNRLWRSSSNQKVHFLTQRYVNYQSMMDQEYRELEFTLNINQIITTGFPEISILKNLTNHRE